MDHFNINCIENNFKFNMGFATRRSLKPGSVPTIFSRQVASGQQETYTVDAGKKSGNRAFGTFPTTPLICDTLSDGEDNNETRNKTNVQDIDDCIIFDVEGDMDINNETSAAVTAVEASALNAVNGLKIRINGDIESENDAPDNDDDDEISLHIKAEDDEEEREKEGDCEEEQEETESNRSIYDVIGEEHHEIEFIDMELNNNAGSIKRSRMFITGATTTKPNDSSAKDNTAIIIPKDHLIDLDTEYDVSSNKKIKPNVVKIMPTLAERLKLTKPSGSTLTHISVPSTTSSTLTTFANIPLTTSTPTEAKIAASPSTGRISIVPRSLLLPPPTTAQQTTGRVTTHQPQQMQFLSNAVSNTPKKIQPRIVSAVPTGIVATGPGGIKVLLVNADQGSTPDQGASRQKELQHQQTVGKQPSQPPPLPPQPAPPVPSQQQENSLPTPSEGIEDACNKCSSVATWQLMRRLHDALEENNDIQRKRLRLENDRLESEQSALEVERKRLALERERLDFERSAFDRLLNILPNMLQQQQQKPRIPQHPQRPQSDHFVSAAVTVAPTAVLVKPSKLVFNSAGAATAFATIVPVVSGTTANNLSSRNQTVSSAAPVLPQQVELCTQINEFQLISPTLEKEE